jgi:hypothetical protein
MVVDENSGTGLPGTAALLGSISTAGAACAEWKVAASEFMLVVLWLLKLGLNIEGMFLLLCDMTETDVSWARDWLVISSRRLWTRIAKL